MAVNSVVPSALRRVVFVPAEGAAAGHDAATKASLAATLARVIGLRCAGSAADAAADARRGDYVVPCETLTWPQAQRLGIATADDLFGGVVPLPFVATKLITHPLPGPEAEAPPGWQPAFAQQVAGVVLDGCSTFNPADARRACARLLRDGAVRLKDADGVGGGGQAVVTSLAQLDAALDSQDFAAAAHHGLVLERNLRQVQTCSVGQIRVDGWTLSYHGEQRLVRDRHGHAVYGGSTLHLVPGDFAALLRTELPPARRLAVEQAQAYHRAAIDCYAGLLASRSNYDVAQGVDDRGQWRSGVLEQSWRIGGASGAEIAALELFRERPGLRWVRASTHELHDDLARPPAGAQLHFDGPDARGDRLLKYATVDAHGHA